MHEPLPEGEAPANETWMTMSRQRLLLPGPGAVAQLVATNRCGHRTCDGHLCRGDVDHECFNGYLGNIGGAQTHATIVYGSRWLTELAKHMAEGL